MVDPSRQDTRKTIVHLITRLDQGGSARNTYLTVLGHDRRRFRVCLVCGQPPALSVVEAELIAADLKELRQAGVSVFTVPTLVREVRPLLDACALVAIWRLLRRERPVVVHTHTSKAGAVGRVAAWLARVPAVIHTPHGHIFYGYYGRAMSGVIRLVEQALARITDRIVTLTDRGAQEHVRYGIADREKFATIPSSIPLSLFRSVQVDLTMKRKEWGLQSEGPVIGTVGRLVPIKGHEWLLKAARRVLLELPHAWFVFIGTGPLLEELRQLAEALRIHERVRFLGARQDVPECLAALDLFAFPSLNEGMGRALIEAMAMGLPVVATRVGGIPDIVTDGETGVLVPARDDGALAGALIGLLREPHRMRKMGSAAKQSVDHRFDVPFMVGSIERLYESVCREKHVAL